MSYKPICCYKLKSHVSINMRHYLDDGGRRRTNIRFHGEAGIDGEFSVRSKLALKVSVFCNCETLMNLKDDNQSGEVARTLVEFLEVAITMIVFLKGFYPSAAFERRRYMNVVVQRARHPQLRDYIHSAASGLLSFIEKGLVERVAVIFFSEDSVPVERFIFKLTINPSCAASVEEGQLEFALRSFLVKLSVAKSLVKPLPQNCRWEVTAYLRSLPEVGSSKEGELWIPTDTKQWQKPPVITPVKSLNSEPLCLQLYLEHPSLSEPQPCQESR